MKIVCYLFFAFTAVGWGEDLIDKLKSESFQQREAAEEELLAKLAVEQTTRQKGRLLREYFYSDDPEFRHRVFNVLLKLDAGQVPRLGSGALGISMGNGPPVNWVQPSSVKGVVIMDTIKNTPAEQAGLERGDLILAVDGVKIEGIAPTLTIKEIISGHPPGRRILLKILRNETLHFVEVPLMSSEAMPSERNFNFPRSLEANPEIDRENLRRDFRKWLESQRKLFPEIQ